MALTNCDGEVNYPTGGARGDSVAKLKGDKDGDWMNKTEVLAEDGAAGVGAIARLAARSSLT